MSIALSDVHKMSSPSIVVLFIIIKKKKKKFLYTEWLHWILSEFTNRNESG
jgi:hypothetical protein